jgi:hypothetical protein
MPAARLSDSQKAELVDRFRGGEGLQPLAEAYGCSPNTVSRVVKSALSPADYERLRDARLKEQRSRRSAEGSAAASPQLDLLAAESAAAQGEADSAAVQGEEDASAALGFDQPVEPAAPPEPLALVAAAPEESDPPAAPPPSPEPVRRRSSPGRPAPPVRAGTRQAPAPVSAASVSAPAAASPEGPSELAIADADDFSDDDAEDDPDDEAADPDDLQDDPEAGEALTLVPLPLLEVVDDHTEIRPRPLQAADLSGSAWMLVDKAVELQARPLSEFPELGRLPPEEQDRQALLVFVNPRQAKRQCGRTQRVIKIPDSAVLARTAPYLLAQGISRLVIEGALFALPGS